jgi:murein DD-endopeptidase MepM/ murein hydrolase activator NlpD
VKAAGGAALSFGHSKIFSAEEENVAVEAAHKTETMAEGGLRAALRRQKNAPYRKAHRLARRAEKESVRRAWQKVLAENPRLKSNAFSRAFQKRQIKKNCAQAARTAQKAAGRAKRAGLAGRAASALAGAVKRHPIAAAIALLAALLLFALTSLIGAFAGMGSGALGGILSASYLAVDTEIESAELAYTEWETDLCLQIENPASEWPGYDEYRLNAGEIAHDPYELMAYLTAMYRDFTCAAILADLEDLFAEQYNLTVTPSAETRYADPSDADGDGDYESNDWRVLTLTLAARDFAAVAAARMNGAQAAHYALLMQSRGARRYILNPFVDLDWLPYVTSNYGYRVHPLSGEKDLHRGVDVALPAGTEIHAGQDGTVTFAGWDEGYGNYVVIEGAEGLKSKYAHCAALNVTTGQTVKTGDIIATVGNTGNSTGPHLHLEVLKGGLYVNPLYAADTGG